MTIKHCGSGKKEAFQAQFDENAPIVIIDPQYELENYTVEGQETVSEKEKTK